ncbi:MAG: hydroxymethylglutaryl-CoA lyase [Acidimicrobiia bacterium]|nr:hydroxymethylglutaryl-CoA lyase [Acidimicrobiia bacterium]MYC44750.1 hydroxymethylglutaryl-CoA lyase [Acidimicrobiia bacterium]MYI19069.1 hydroxymethylglutaryl-CoA lyase [Acidimicrobiia bacterium]
MRPGPAAAVEIVDVAARDGLQSDPTAVSTAGKVELIARLVDAGVRRLEAASFVNPKRVPQMADAEAVMAALPRSDDVTYIGLVMNRRGLDRALAAGVDEINAVVVCSDTFCERNQGTTTAGAVSLWEELAEGARAGGISAGVTLSAAFGCPYEGHVPVERLAAVAAEVVRSNPAEIAIADSIGVAVPQDVTERVAAVREAVGDGVRLRAHFHNTRNTGYANALAAVDAGVEVLDASLGGIGGCPFAPNATGNIATEDLVYLLDRTGVDTGVSLEALCESVLWLEEILDHPVPGYLSKAGGFPGGTAA